MAKRRRNYPAQSPPPIVAALPSFGASGVPVLKRRVSIPYKLADGEQLEAELKAAGVPLVPGGAIEADGQGRLVVMIDLPAADGSKDATALAVLNAHVKPAELTDVQIRRKRARKILDEFPDLLSLIIRAVALENIDAHIALRSAYMALRADLRANRTGAAGTAPTITITTVQQAIDSILARIDSLIP